jgi:hypothetical protein
MKRTLVVLSCAVLCLSIAVSARAQGGAIAGAITGIVKDPSGLPVANAMVEAASPALIEKSRTTRTDDQGLYKIVNLPAGTYTVTFSADGFNRVQREGVELMTSFTATVDASMTVGSVAQTVTVTEAVPVLDTTSTEVQKVLANNVLASLPIGKSAATFVSLIPGAVGTATNQDVGGTKGENTQGFRIHGSLTGDYIQLRDGMFFGTLVAAGNFMTSTNPTSIQEVTLETSGYSAQNWAQGGQINFIPRQGGNNLHGSFQSDFGSKGLQWTNVTPDLAARGVNTTQPSIRKLYEIAGGFGGPIIKDKLWFYADGRHWISESYQVGNYFNANEFAPFPNNLLYVADLSRPAYDQNFYYDGGLRMTWQASARNKFTAAYENDITCNCFFNVGGGSLAPEAAGHHYYTPNWRVQGTWSFPATGKLLLWAGVTTVFGNARGYASGGGPDSISVTDNTKNNYVYGASGTGLSLTTSYGSQGFFQTNENFSADYITGPHALKFGLTEMQARGDRTSVVPPGLGYVFAGPTPKSINEFISPWSYQTHMTTHALFAQDQYRILKRLTLSLGLRLDSLIGSTPAQSLPAYPQYGIAASTYAPVSSTPNWWDLNPRFGGSWDVFGNGRTAFKASIGRSINQEQLGGTALAVNPVNTIVTQVSRTWTDNGNYIPDCNLANPNANGECGKISNLAFGSPSANTTYSSDVTKGFGTRGYNWQFMTSVQQQVSRGVAVSFGFYRTWFGNFTAVQNTAVPGANYDQYCTTEPTDARLPDSGAKICNLWDVQPSFQSVIKNVVLPASQFGHRSDVYTGIDVTVNARLSHGVVVLGGVTSGHEVTDQCFQVNSPQDLYYTSNVTGASANSNFGTTSTLFPCHISPPWYSNTQVKFAVVYPLPWWGIKFSANEQNLPSIPLTASYVFNGGQVSFLNPVAGHTTLSAGAAAQQTIELITPATMFNEGRNNQTDFRMAKNFSIRERWKIEPTVDFYNLFNAHSVLGITTRYGASWQNITSLLPARMLKFGIHIDF